MMRSLRSIRNWLAPISLLLGYCAVRYIDGFELRVVALDEENGQVLWTRVGNFEGKLATSGNLVFVKSFHLAKDYTYSFQVVALNAATGEEQWQTSSELVQHYNAPLYLNANGLYYGVLDAQSREYLVALDPNTGRERWRIERSWSGLSFPESLGVVANGDRLIFINQVGTEIKLQAVEALTAKPIWQVHLGSLDSTSTNNPKLNLAINNHSIFFQDSLGTIYSYDAVTGQVQFTIPPGKNEYQEIQVTEDLIYRQDSEGITAFKSETGQLLWQRQGRSSTNGTFHNNAICQTNWISQFAVNPQGLSVTCGDQDTGTWLAQLDDSNGQRQWLQHISSDITFSVDENVLTTNTEAIFVEIMYPGISEPDPLTFKGPQQIVSVSAITGEQRWNFVRNGRFAISSLAVDGDRVYILDESPRWRNWFVRQW